MYSIGVSEVISDKEKELAHEVAGRAMVAGWDKAIGWAASQYGVSQLDIKIILDRASEFNLSADPTARIPELDDWLREKRGRSERAQSSKLHLLSPGLRAYMEAKKQAQGSR
jgi:hypothetical protein